jgi:hypothetical protein
MIIMGKSLSKDIATKIYDNDDEIYLFIFA